MQDDADSEHCRVAIMGIEVWPQDLAVGDVPLPEVLRCWVNDDEEFGVSQERERRTAFYVELFYGNNYCQGVIFDNHEHDLSTTRAGATDGGAAFKAWPSR